VLPSKIVTHTYSMDRSGKRLNSGTGGAGKTTSNGVAKIVGGRL
jgi:hypothetical protein